MTKARNADLASVIHIRAGAPGESEQMDALLKTMPCHVVTWMDVYRSLARLGRLARDPAHCPRLRAVIVEVESLTASEMPFFTFASRLFPHVPILVYGAHAGSTRISEACQIGATGWADKDTIRGLLESSAVCGDRADSRHEDPEVPAEPNRSPLDQRIDPPPSTPIAQPRVEETRIEGPAVKPDDVDPIGDERNDPDPDETLTRVPWRRYKDVPTRRGPTRVKPVIADSKPSDENDEVTIKQRDSGEDTGPLLTDEELRALIGDDISAIAPREPSSRRPSDRPERGGDT